MNEKEKLQTVLEGLRRKMRKCTSDIEKVDQELEWLQEVSVNDTVLDTIRHQELRLQDLQADRNALWIKFQRLSEKLKTL